MVIQQGKHTERVEFDGGTLSKETYQCESYPLKQGGPMKKTSKKTATAIKVKVPEKIREPKKLYLAFCEDCTWRADGVARAIAITRANTHDKDHNVVLYLLATEEISFTSTGKIGG